MGKGDSYRKVDRDKFERHFLQWCGYCNQNLCSKSWACKRHCDRIGENKRSYVPKPENYDTCEYYSPARCELCQGKGWNRDYNKTQRKYIKASCLVCRGDGVLDYDKLTKEKK
jgi:hypothetical protein